MRPHALVVSFAVLLGAPAAFADVTPPDVSACQGKAVGAACTMSATATGVCAKGTCSRLDYGSWDRDAMSSPPTVSYECVRCVEGSPATTPANDSGGCSMAARSAGTWALALTPAVALALWERRRRRSKKG
jgi:hypothetical protein